MSTALSTLTLTPEAQELIAFSQTFLATVTAIKITSADEAQIVVDQLRRIKETAKTVEQVRKEYTDPLNAEVKAYMDAFRPAAEVLAKAETVGKGALSAWDTEQRRIASIAADEKRKADKLEQDRLAEEQRKADALLAQADEAAASGDVAAAEALEEQAAAVQTQAVYIAAPVTLAPEKPKGSSSRMAWKARIIDAALVPNEYKIINEKAIQAFAAAMKENAKLPGVEFYAEPVISIR